jgi:hypothetical protein
MGLESSIQSGIQRDNTWSYSHRLNNLPLDLALDGNADFILLGKGRVNLAVGSRKEKASTKGTMSCFISGRRQARYILRYVAQYLHGMRARPSPRAWLWEATFAGGQK